MTTDIADSRLGMRAQYERCGLALARLRAIANPGDGSPGGYAAGAVEEAMEQVLAGLRDASRTVDELARRPATAVLLRRRLTRLEHCADDVRAAFAEATGLSLRRRVQHFCALATASWRVCLSLHPDVRHVPAADVVTRWSR